YLQRFKCLNFLINSSNGPQFQLNGLNSAKLNFEEKVKNTADKLATFSNIVRYGGFLGEPTGSVIKIDGANQFQVSDAVILNGDNLPSIECTIVNITGTSVEL